LPANYLAVFGDFLWNNPLLREVDYGWEILETVLIVTITDVEYSQATIGVSNRHSG